MIKIEVYEQALFETIKRGIPMFVEKPVALDIELARKIRDEVEKAGLITAVGFQCRYSNIVKDTQEFVKRHTINFVNCFRMGGIPDTPWWKVKSLSGGQIVEQNIRRIDKNRAKTRELICDQKWSDPSTYDLTVNTSGWDIKHLTPAVAEFVSRWFTARNGNQTI